MLVQTRIRLQTLDMRTPALPLPAETISSILGSTKYLLNLQLPHLRLQAQTTTTLNGPISIAVKTRLPLRQDLPLGFYDDLPNRNNRNSPFHTNEQYIPPPPPKYINSKLDGLRSRLLLGPEFCIFIYQTRRRLGYSSSSAIKHEIIPI